MTSTAKTMVMKKKKSATRSDDSKTAGITMILLPIIAIKETIATLASKYQLILMRLLDRMVTLLGPAVWYRYCKMSHKRAKS